MASDTPKLNVEIFTASHCNSCLKIKTLVRDVLASLQDDRLHLREIDVVEEIDYAVQVGVLRTPCIVINEQIIFTTFPSKKSLKKAITQILENPQFDLSYGAIGNQL